MPPSLLLEPEEEQAVPQPVLNMALDPAPYLERRNKLMEQLAEPDTAMSPGELAANIFTSVLPMAFGYMLDSKRGGAAGGKVGLAVGQQGREAFAQDANRRRQALKLEFDSNEDRLAEANRQQAQRMTQANNFQNELGMTRYKDILADENQRETQAFQASQNALNRAAQRGSGESEFPVPLAVQDKYKAWLRSQGASEADLAGPLSSRQIKQINDLWDNQRQSGYLDLGKEKQEFVEDKEKGKVSTPVVRPKTGFFGNPEARKISEQSVTYYKAIDRPINELNSLAAANNNSLPQTGSEGDRSLQLTTALIEIIKNAHNQGANFTAMERAMNLDRTQAVMFRRDPTEFIKQQVFGGGDTIGLLNAFRSDIKNYAKTQIDAVGYEAPGIFEENTMGAFPTGTASPQAATRKSKMIDGVPVWYTKTDQGWVKE